MLMSKIKQFLLGMLVGMLIGIPMVLAAQGITLQKGTGEEIGTTDNPMVVTPQ